MSEASRERTPVSFLRVSLFSLVILGIIVGVFLWIEDPQQKTNFSDAISPVVEALATASLLIAAKHSAARSKRLALAWGTIGLAMLLYTLGDFTWAILELVQKVSPFPSFADACYLAYYPAFLAGVVLLTNRPASSREQFKRALDLLIILAASILGFWNFLIAPGLQSNASASLLEQLILLAYPVGDLVLLGALLLIIYNASTEQDKITVSLLAAGIVITILADSFYSFQGLARTYVSGGLLDLGWIAGNVSIGLAGATKWCAMPPADSTGRLQALDASRGRLENIRTYLPYAWTLGALGLLITSGLTPLPMSASSISLGVAAIVGLVLVRQTVTLSENSKLNIELQSQSARLHSANQDLNTEITERLRIAEQLSHDALHDALTGLANRVLFLDHLALAIEQSKRLHGQAFAVLFMDLDQFKVVNDSLGHFYGDQLLIQIGKRLKQTLRSSDTIARFGGDEFAVLLTDVKDDSSARILAERIQAAMRLHFTLGGREVHMTFSIGIATDALKYERAQDFLRDADLAMYQAKALGRARSEVFAAEMRTHALFRLEMEDDLRRGLERQEFQLYYQPTKSLESNEIVGFEALLRWMHPTRGLLLPAEFLQVAEESGLILPIGDWVLDQACFQLKTWQQQHPNLQNVSVSVNLSNKQFSQPALAAKVAKALSVSGLKGSALRLEITEQVLVGHDPLANDLIAELKDMGVQMQIDDFGSGYSALAYLQQFPVCAIKVDRSFVSRISGDPKGLGLVRAIVSMARELGMDAIAEGIETGEQLKELKGLSCGYGQGFLLAGPMDAASVEKALANPKLAAGA